MGKAVVEISLAEEIAPVVEQVVSLEKRVSALETMRLSDQLAYRVGDVGKLVGFSTGQIMKMIERGELKARKCGKPVLVTRQALLEWLDSLPAYTDW